MIPQIQKIAVLLTQEQSDTNLLLAAMRLAEAFRKELLLISLITKIEKLDHEKAILDTYAATLRREIPQVPVTVSAMPHPGNNLARVLSDELEAIMLIAGSQRFTALSKHLRNSPIPFLFINEREPFLSEFKKVIIPVDMRKQNKDSLLWSVFFGRNNGSEIIAIGANDKSKEGRKMVASHLNALKRLVVKSGVAHKLYKGSHGSLSVQQEALATAGDLNADLLILLGSSYITWLDRLIGLPEEKTLRNAGSLPVLLVNPRRETYLVCD